MFKIVPCTQDSGPVPNSCLNHAQTIALGPRIAGPHPKGSTRNFGPTPPRLRVPQARTLRGASICRSFILDIRQARREGDEGMCSPSRESLLIVALSFVVIYVAVCRALDTLDLTAPRVRLWRARIPRRCLSGTAVTLAGS